MISILGTIAGTAWAWAAPLIVRHGVKIGIVAAILAGYLAQAAYHRAEGRSQVVRASQKEGERRNADAAKVRRQAETPGSVDRLRREYCRDC